MSTLTVQFLKYPNVLHWGFEGELLGDDEWGTWVAAPVGTRHWKGEEPDRFSTVKAVLMSPRNGWWHLHYNGDGGRSYRLFVDICTPPQRVAADRIEMVDLDLDVGLTQDSEVVVEDEDEFEVHQVEFGYTMEMIEEAMATTQSIVKMLETSQEPFFEVAEAWLRKI